MHATVHPIEGIPGPQETAWVDEVLSTLRSRATPAGTLVARPLGPGAGTAVALWDDETDAAAATDRFGPAGGVTLGAGQPYEITLRKAGTSGQPARYLQLVTFAGPRDPEWSAAFDRADEERVWPAVRDLPGTIEVLGGTAADAGRFIATLAESVEALEDIGAAIMSTELLPGEDPAYLTGPDTFAVLRLLHADLPVGATR